MDSRRFRLGAALAAVIAVLCALSSAANLRSPLAGNVSAQEPAADAPAEPAPAAAAPAAPAGGAPAAPAEAPKPRQSYLAWLYGALGFKYTIAFLFLSFALVALLVMNLLAVRRDAICPKTLVEQFEQQLGEKRYQEAYDMAKADESFLGQVLAAGMVRLSDGYDKVMHAMQEIGEEENMKMEHRLSYIALIGTVAPMVGLLGTVDGMVRSFTVIAQSAQTPKPSELAMGISMALVTTLAGLVIAIPAIAVFNILKNRVARLVFEVGVTTGQLMARFEKGAAK